MCDSLPRPFIYIMLTNARWHHIVPGYQEPWESHGHRPACAALRVTKTRASHGLAVRSLAHMGGMGLIGTCDVPQAATLAALAMAGVVDVYEHRNKTNEVQHASIPLAALFGKSCCRAGAEASMCVFCLISKGCKKAQHDCLSR